MWFDPYDPAHRYRMSRANRPPRTQSERDAEAAKGKINERHIASQIVAWSRAETGREVGYEEHPDEYATVDGWILLEGARIRLLESKARSPMPRPDGYYRVEVKKMTALLRESRRQGLPALLAFGFADQIAVLRLDPTEASANWVDGLGRGPLSEGDEAHLVPVDAWKVLPLSGWVVDPSPFAGPTRPNG